MLTMRTLITLALILLAGCSAVPSMDCINSAHHNDGPPRKCWTARHCLDGSVTNSTPFVCNPDGSPVK